MVRDLSGRVFGEYALLEKVGVGAFGEVYYARCLETGEPVALKIRECSSLEALQEAELHQKLSHPNIVSVKDFGVQDKKIFIVMEHCSQSVREKLEEGDVTLEEAVRIALDVLAGLEYIHQNGIVHRDVKPENILEGEDGVFKLCDFGLFQPLRQFDCYGTLLESVIASFDSSNPYAGTHYYMAPEQQEGLADHRSDIFAAGTVLYEMIKGHRPDGTYESIGNRGIDAVIQKSRYWSPVNRFQSAGEMQKALASAMQGMQDDNSFYEAYAAVVAVDKNPDADASEKEAVYLNFLAYAVSADYRCGAEVYNNLGCLQMNEYGDYGSAKKSFARAVECAEEDVKENPGSQDAGDRLAKYQRNLKACRHNIAVLTKPRVWA